jgi:hypothetical protein
MCSRPRAISTRLYLTFLTRSFRLFVFDFRPYLLSSSTGLRAGSRAQSARTRADARMYKYGSRRRRARDPRDRVHSRRASAPMFYQTSALGPRSSGLLCRIAGSLGPALFMYLYCVSRALEMRLAFALQSSSPTSLLKSSTRRIAHLSSRALVTLVHRRRPSSIALTLATYYCAQLLLLGAYLALSTSSRRH